MVKRQMIKRNLLFPTGMYSTNKEIMRYLHTEFLYYYLGIEDVRQPKIIRRKLVERKFILLEGFDWIYYFDFPNFGSYPEWFREGKKKR